jgi:outer membrane lipoprotein-sorting protein
MISRTQFACSILIYLATGACVSGQTQSPVPTNEIIVAEMVQAQAENRTRFRPYMVTRDYKLFDGGNHQEAKFRVVAEITFVPPDSKEYIIQDKNGSGWGEKIVRKMLDGEMAFSKDSGSTDITRDNYDFLFVREDNLKGQRCYVLELLPRRKVKNLLRGTIWVDAHTYLLHRVEGEPAKSPSWWLRDVRIVLLYGYVGEMWLQTSSEATANVRILGPSTMVSQDVRYRIGELTSGAALAQTMVSVRETIAKDQR